MIFVESYGRVALTDPDIAPAVTASAGGRDPPARGGGLAGAERLPHLPDRRGRQLAGPLDPAVGPLDRQPAALSQPGGQRPAHLDPRVRRRRLAHHRRSCRAPPRPGRTARSTTTTRSTTPGRSATPARRTGGRGCRISTRSPRAERLMTDGPDGRPTMAVVPLVSSHAPWTPVPGLVDPATVGDGSTLIPAGGSAEPPEAILTRDPARVRADYRQSVVYTLTSVIRQLERDSGRGPGGDHGRRSPAGSGGHRTRRRSGRPDHRARRDPGVIDRIRDWGWTPGLHPAADAPVWRMDAVRDRILTDFGADRPR